MKHDGSEDRVLSSQRSGDLARGSVPVNDGRLSGLNNSLGSQAGFRET